jgi:hypothetical protein
MIQGVKELSGKVRRVTVTKPVSVKNSVTVTVTRPVSVTSFGNGKDEYRNR